MILSLPSLVLPLQDRGSSLVTSSFTTRRLHTLHPLGRPTLVSTAKREGIPFFVHTSRRMPQASNEASSPIPTILPFVVSFDISAQAAGLSLLRPAVLVSPVTSRSVADDYTS